VTSESPWWTVIPRPWRRRAPVFLKRLAVLTAYHNAIVRHPILGFKYLFLGRELDNFTYQVGNLDELASFIALVAGVDRGEAAASIAELEDDAGFRQELELKMRSKYRSHQRIYYGRRTGWYALIRALRPGYVIETGVHDGLGSAVILQALKRNSDVGAEGQLSSVDIDPESGWLVPERLRSRWQLVIGDSLGFLNRLNHRTVDLFIHDSDHRYAHEWAEYLAVGDRISPNGILLSDNSHAQPTLQDYSIKQKRRFLLWREKPLKHWYPGAGIGVSAPAVASRD
jgi:predicted O-methyltransferase YrrM